MSDLNTILIPVTIFVTVIGLGGAVLLVYARRAERLRGRLGSARQMPGDATRPSAWADVAKSVGKKVAPRGVSAKLQQQLARAGYYEAHAVSIYMGAKFLLLAIGLAVLTFMVYPLDSESMSSLTKLLIVASGGAVLSFVPNLVLQQRLRRRRWAVRSHLPDALDLLEISVSAGLGLDAAWNSVADEIRPMCPILADEMALTNLELHLGASRADSLRNMAERTGADEITSLVGAMVQSERLGTSIAEMLRNFAANMREIRSFQAEEAAEKMAVKLLFPMVLFIFPVVLIIAVGPALIALSKALK